MVLIESFFLVTIVVAILLVVYYILTIIYMEFREVGFRASEVSILLFISLLVQGLNVPLFYSEDMIIAANVAGFFIPLYLTYRFISTGRLKTKTVTVAAMIVTPVAYYSSAVTESGIIINMIYPSIVAAVISIPLSRKNWHHAGIIAYSAGSMGTFIGADLLRLRGVMEVVPVGGMIASIGGAGVLDGIFLIGLIAVLIDIAVLFISKIGSKLMGDV